jgi:G:T-mismatch repair DNA endonuclease (very short patch repair protein)
MQIGKKRDPYSLAHRRAISLALTGKKGKIPWNKGLKNSQVPWNKGIKCPQISKSKIGHAVSEETLEKLKKSRALFGSRPPWNKGKNYTPEQIEKYKARWRDPEYKDRILKQMTRKAGKRPNNLEVRFDKFLQSNFPNQWKYVGNGEVWLGGKCPDWINVDGEKKVIELFGTFWHKPEDEKVRTEHFKQFGFDTIVVWDYEFRKNPEKIKTELKGD